VTRYLRAIGRGLAVVTATVGWLVLVPFVDLLRRRNDREIDEHAQHSVVLLARAEAA
jgi:hypothetical protein